MIYLSNAFGVFSTIHEMNLISLLSSLVVTFPLPAPVFRLPPLSLLLTGRNNVGIERLFSSLLLLLIPRISSSGQRGNSSSVLLFVTLPPMPLIRGYEGGVGIVIKERRKLLHRIATTPFVAAMHRQSSS